MTVRIKCVTTNICKVFENSAWPLGIPKCWLLLFSLLLLLLSLSIFTITCDPGTLSYSSSIARPHDFACGICFCSQIS